jgi:phosphatidate cytidylyltransferase
MPKKLRQRVLTALILIPSVVGGIMYLPSSIVAVALSVFVLIAAWEWTYICGCRNFWLRVSYVLLLVVALIALFFVQHYYPISIFLILAIALSWWLWMLYWQLGVEFGWLSDPIPRSSWTKAALGLLILLPPWLSLVFLHLQYTGYGVLFFFCLIWLADSSAYFVGKNWGRYKLAIKISPKKTWEGVYAALISGWLLSLGFVWWRELEYYQSLLFMLLCLLTILVSILGDLAESMFKRQMQLKDSSQLLPGHGGMLDRIDSITSAAPIFVIGIILIGIKF